MSEYDPTAEDNENPYAVGYLSIQIAEVVEVNYEEMSLFFRIKNANESNRTPVPITFPSIGNRMFLGGMPQVGDFAVVGWAMEGGSKSPVVLSWIGAGLAMAKDWMMSAPFQQEEYDMNQESSEFFKGAYNRIRHKLRSLHSGDILASSASGSDILLDEGVLLTNRRGNEIHIRDADQSIVTQSLNLFNVQAGVRSYSGTVQRDFFNLPNQMFSDGVKWDRFALFDKDFRILPEEDSDVDMGVLTPHDIFEIDEDGGLVTDLFGEELNPAVFLQTLGVINEDLTRIYPFEENPSIYGGKMYYRVENRIGEKLTEHRIELTHSTNETLPMSEQTENGLDPEEDSPFIEQVMGTVISNDKKDPDMYGRPLTAKIFPKPDLMDASNKDVTEHLSYLTRITPPIEKPNLDTTPYMFAVAKNGRVFLNVSGRRNGDADFSAEARFGSGIEIEMGRNAKGISLLSRNEGSFQVQARGNSEENIGIALEAEESGVTIKANGTISTPTQLDDETNVPLSVLIQGEKSVGLFSNNSIVFSAPNGMTFTELGKYSANPKDLFEINTDQLATNSKTISRTVSGQEQVSFSGPKDNKPTNYPLRETSLTTSFPSPTAKIDEVKISSGVQTKTISTNGSFRKRIRGTGKIIQSVTTGAIKNTVGTCKTQLNNTDFSVSVAKTVKVLAGGTIKQSATGKITLKAGAIARLQGTVVELASLGGQRGGIICDGTINPITGAPFKASGVIGSPTHRLK